MSTGAQSVGGHNPVRLTATALGLLLVGALAGAGPVGAVELPEQAPVRPTDTALEGAAATLLVDEPSAVAIPEIGPVADRIWEHAESLAAEHWDLRFLADSLELDPMAAFYFVRDHIRYEPYRGVLRGAEGTLAARAGNSYDRAMLLAALLDQMLVDYEFAFAKLEGPALDAVLDAARTGPSVGLDDELPGSRLDVSSIADRARRDYALLMRTLSSQAPLLQGTDEASSLTDARDHVWLRIAYGAETMDLDTTLPGAEPGDSLATADRTALTIADDERHEVRLRVVIEELDGSVLAERVLLDETLDAIDSAGSELFVLFEPDLSGFSGAILSVLSGDERWSPVLMRNGEPTVGASFSAGGSGRDLLGEPTELPELVSLRLIASTLGPHLPPVEATHLLFDRRDETGTEGAFEASDGLPPLVLRDGVPLALTGVTQVMVSTGGASPRTYAYHQVQLLDLIDAGLFDPEIAAQFSLADRLWPMAMAGQGLVLTSEQVLVPAAGGVTGHGYVARPRIYLASLRPVAGEPDALTEITDLMIDSVRIMPFEPSTATAPQQLWYGVLQAALETETGLRRLTGEGGGDFEIEGASLSMREPLTLLTADMATTWPKASAALVADMEAGSMVVVAGDPEAAQEWWSVDPVSGATRAMLAPGLRGYRQSPDDQRPALAVSDMLLKKTLTGGTRSGNRLFRPPGGSDRASGFNPNDYKTPRKPGLPRGTKFKPPRSSIPQRPSPTSRCGGGNEYASVIGCVSLPTAVAFYALGAVYGTSITGIAYGLLVIWLE